MSQVTAPPVGVAPLGRMMVGQVKSVLIVYSRQLGFVAISVGLPIMFFLFFGLPNVGKRSGGIEIGAFILASLGTYAVSNVVVYNVGIGVATQRGRKFDLLQRATPLPPFIAILGNVVGGLGLSLISLIVLFIVADIGGVHMALGTWIALLGWLVLGCLPMLGLGLSIGYGASPNSAPALASLIYLPVAFASGLFIPLKQLPDFIRSVAKYLPLYHEGQLGWITVGAGDESRLAAVAWVLGWSVVLLALAARAYRRDAQRKFG
ncbi:MAG: ABC transporter permease [Candidatus Dormibacteraeota bacterium]|nr:ABC transporter permease [Candidatus Dormibacteraeota bacterium]